MALRRHASCILRLLVRDEAELLSRLHPQSAWEAAQTPLYRHFAVACSSAQLQQGHRLLNDSSAWGRDASRGFHISLQGNQSAQAAAVQQQEEEDNGIEQPPSAVDPACVLRKGDVQQSKAAKDIVSLFIGGIMSQVLRAARADFHVRFDQPCKKHP